MRFSIVANYVPVAIGIVFVDHFFALVSTILVSPVTERLV
jgi:hypothetical protein